MDPIASLVPSDHATRLPDGSLRLLGGRCTQCDISMFPAQPLCPACAGDSVVVEPQPPAGTLYSYTVLHVGKTGPRAFGYIDLPNGARVFARLASPEVRIGETMRVAGTTEEWCFEGEAG